MAIGVHLGVVQTILHKVFVTALTVEHCGDEIHTVDATFGVFELVAERVRLHVTRLVIVEIAQLGRNVVQKAVNFVGWFCAERVVIVHFARINIDER